MGLVFSSHAISEILKDSVVSSGIHAKVSIKKTDSEDTYVFSEKDDGSNNREIFKAVIVCPLEIENFIKIYITITPLGKTSVKDIREIAKTFFEENGDCTIEIA